MVMTRKRGGSEDDDDDVDDDKTQFNGVKSGDCSKRRFDSRLEADDDLTTTTTTDDDHENNEKAATDEKLKTGREVGDGRDTRWSARARVHEPPTIGERAL